MSLPWGTGTFANLTIGSATYIGEEWEFPAYMPWSGDTSDEADTYRTRNAGWSRKCDFFGGVRYATATRFKPPVLYNAGTSTFHCRDFDAVPFQDYTLEAEGSTGRPATGFDDGQYEWSGYGAEESEDCLRVHIWRPQGTAPGSGWPCVVWFHGGGWDINSAASYQIWGNFLASMGIVFISAEYRLGLLGSFYHADIAAEGDYAGPHFAVMDMIKALEWVDTYASDLEIDTTKIGIAGTSAGGEGVSFMLEDATAQGYFTRAWISSGGGMSHRWNAEASWQNEGYLKRTARVAKTLEDCGDLIRASDGRTFNQIKTADGWPAALRAVPAETFAQVQGTGFDGQNAFPYVSTSDYPDANAVKAIRNSRWDTGIPVVVGFAGNEANLLGITKTSQTLNINEAGYARIVGLNWSEIAAETPFSAWSAAEQARMIYQMSAFWSGAYSMAYELTSAGGDAWLYEQNYKSAGNGGDYPGHSSEQVCISGHIPWQIGMTGNTASDEVRVYVDDIKAFCGFAQSFVNFVANGNPNTLYRPTGYEIDLFDTPPAFTWTQFSTANKNTNVFGSLSRFFDACDPVLTNQDDWYSGILDQMRQSAK